MEKVTVEGHGVKDIEALNREFVDYLNFGGFPEAVFHDEVRRRMDRFVADDIIDKVLLRDLPSPYGIGDTQELNRFFTALAYNTGEEVSLEGLSQSSQVAKNTLKKYLEYLEAAFLIVRLYRVDWNARRFKRQNYFKVYLANPCLRSALFGAIGPDDPAMGRMVETALITQLSQSTQFGAYCYARWKTGEVDLVYFDRATQRLLWALEVKWSDRAIENPETELRALIEFCAANKLSQGYVSTRTKSGKQIMRGVELVFSPVALHCYAAARTLVLDELKAGRHPLGEALWP